MATGFLEGAIQEIFSDLIRARAVPPVSLFALRSLGRNQNPTPENIFKTTAGFDASWAQALKDFLAQNGRKEALESLINQRHLIAHGKNSSINITITMASLSGHLKKVVEIIDFLEKQVTR